MGIELRLAEYRSLEWEIEPEIDRQIANIQDLISKEFPEVEEAEQEDLELNLPSVDEEVQREFPQITDRKKAVDEYIAHRQKVYQSEAYKALSSFIEALQGKKQVLSPAGNPINARNNALLALAYQDLATYLTKKDDLVGAYEALLQSDDLLDILKPRDRAFVRRDAFAYLTSCEFMETLYEALTQRLSFYPSLDPNHKEESDMFNTFLGLIQQKKGLDSEEAKKTITYRIIAALHELDERNETLARERRLSSAEYILFRYAIGQGLQDNYGDLGNLDNALSINKELDRIYPNSFFNKTNLGDILLKQRKPKDAQAVYEDIERVSPGNRIAEEGFAEISLLLDKKGQALMHYLRAMELEPSKIVAIAREMLKHGVYNVLFEQGYEVPMLGFEVAIVGNSPEPDHVLLVDQLRLFRDTEELARSREEPVPEVTLHYRLERIHQGESLSERRSIRSPYAVTATLLNPWAQINQTGIAAPGKILIGEHPLTREEIFRQTIRRLAYIVNSAYAGPFTLDKVRSLVNTTG